MPMIPPPITSSLRGTPRSSNAPVESTMRGSWGRKGSFAACDPAAMIALLNRMERSPARSSLGPVNLPSAVTTSTLRILAIEATPPLSLATTLSFQARSFSNSSFGSPKEMPWEESAFASSITAATWSRALEGMQPTLRQTPPSALYFSTRMTRCPRSAARKAAEYPPGPDPSTSTSQSAGEDVDVDVGVDGDGDGDVAGDGEGEGDGDGAVPEA